MAMPVRPTLRELRESVLLRTGFSPIGGAAQRVAPQIDERIREAQEYIHINLDFTHLWSRAAVPLEEGVADYDWPDNVAIGDLRRVIVVRNDGFEMDLGNGLTTDERNTAAWSGDPADASAKYSAPRLWTVENQIIHIAPAPSSEWTQLMFEAFLSPTPLIADEDRAVVDAEALRKLSEAFVRAHFGMPGTSEARENFKAYVMDLRTKQGDGEGLQLGGRQSIRLQTDRRNRLGFPGNGAYSYGAGAPGGPLFFRW